MQPLPTKPAQYPSTVGEPTDEATILRQAVTIYTAPGVLSDAQRAAMQAIFAVPPRGREIGGWVTIYGDSRLANRSQPHVKVGTAKSLAGRGLIELTPLWGSKARLTTKGEAICRAFGWPNGEAPAATDEQRTPAVSVPTEPAEPVYTFHITPSTPEARERIADGAEKPELLRGTLAQGRDLARLLDASIVLLDALGNLAFQISRDGGYSRVGEQSNRSVVPAALPILMVNAASAADDRLSDLGWTTATVTFHATGFALAGAYCNDDEVWFVATISEAKDEETGGSVVGLEFRAQNRDAPLVVVEHADDLVTALLIAIDDNL